MLYILAIIDFDNISLAELKSILENISSKNKISGFDNKAFAKDSFNFSIDDKSFIFVYKYSSKSNSLTTSLYHFFLVFLSILSLSNLYNNS